MVKKKTKSSPSPPAKPQWGTPPTPQKGSTRRAPPVEAPITKDSPVPSSTPLWSQCEDKLLALIDERINEHKKALMVHHLKVQQDDSVASTPSASTPGKIKRLGSDAEQLMA
uniref:Uncharacterized protein n=1 Tax=Tetraselmis chuii TaxID=63592 RepID=A0A7S1SJS0_9CHLO|mmetsp:Transcript_15828/g.28099  ORF Transcript_15828/g.28099 Transcript_15828/m.28099 type:complete len:112 (+) Transcript_15828:387-722(+)|eukprot:CAMPEP_0177772352 /NCGR_PEP_ID=MMETSP0491_2-20121128/12173_1 /TAXON_ID=63592 /ORGANISM="Tetraselmis chuii, Strain PLY429" /LENGTH=111 /DNA_ID=CAMNT_0019290149 /DNA_START=350 /DNA_END=685 /DNA_ORIENTATION=+